MQEKFGIITRKILSSWKRRKTRLLVFTGKKKSGKDALLFYVLRNYKGFRHYRIAEAPLRIAKVLGLPPDRRVFHALFGVNKMLYPLLGESVYKRRVARMLDRDRPHLAIVETVRTKEEYEEFVVKRNGLLIGVTADDHIRYKRAVTDAKGGREKRDEGKMSFREFMARELVPIEREIKWIVARAHFILENSYTKKALLYRAIDQVMTQLGFQKRKR